MIDDDDSRFAFAASMHVEDKVVENNLSEDKLKIQGAAVASHK